MGFIVLVNQDALLSHEALLELVTGHSVACHPGCYEQPKMASRRALLPQTPHRQVLTRCVNKGMGMALVFSEWHFSRVL